jgi:hypothetical protein
MSDTTLVIFEEQQHYVPTEIAINDDKLRALFAPYAPAAASAKIERTEDKVTMIKQSGPKGQQATPIQFLQQALPTLNPAIVMARQVQRWELRGQLTSDHMEAMSEAVETAISKGQQAVYDYRASLEALKAVPGSPTQYTPIGF